MFTAEQAEAQEDDRAVGMALWGLSAGLGATALALIGSGGDGGASAGAPVHPPLEPPTGVGPGNGGIDGGGAHEGTEPPPRPRAGRLQCSLLDDTGASALDRVTAQGGVRLQVSDQEPGAQVRYQWSADGGATWQDCSDQLQGLPDGVHLLRAVVSNAGGETFTTPVAVTVDTSAPLAGQLQISAPVFQGSSFQLSVDGQEAGTSLLFEISTDGGRSWAPTAQRQQDLPDGDYLFRGVVTDLAGNQSATATQVVTVDTQPPAAQALQLRKVGVLGSDALAPLSATGDIDLVLNLPPDITAIYQQSTDGGKTWLDVSAQVRGLAEGQYWFRAVLQDAAGHQTVLAEVPLTVDTTPPPSFQLNALATSGDPINGYLSTSGSFQLGLSALPDSRIAYEFRLVGATTWSVCNSSAIGALDGHYEFRAIATDDAGNRSYSNTIQITVDTRDAAAGTITLGDFIDSGADGLDRLSADASFTLVHIPVDPVQSVTWWKSTNGGNNWVATSAAQDDLPDGRYAFRAVVTDALGATHTTRTVEVTIDGNPPGRPRLELQGFDDTGALGNDRISTDGTFSLNAVNVAADTFYRYEVSLDGGRTWLPTGAQQNLASGSYQFRAVAVDHAGNPATSVAVALTVDREAPEAGQPQLKDFDDTGLAGDRITADSSFSLTAVDLEAGASVRYWHSSDAGQSWSLTTAAQSGLADGEHWYRLELTDLAGNTSLGQPLVITVDTQAPDAGQLQLTGLAGPGQGLDLQWQGTDPVASVKFEVSVDGGQQWLPVLAHTDRLDVGDYLFRATVADAAGNTATTATVAWQVQELVSTLNDVGSALLPLPVPPPPVL